MPDHLNGVWGTGPNKVYIVGDFGTILVGPPFAKQSTGVAKALKGVWGRNDGDVYVVAHSSAVAAILAQADQTNGSGWFNGDDAVVLRKGTTVIDVVGQIGFDPGTEWGTGLTSTADNTLRRKAGGLRRRPERRRRLRPDPAVGRLRDGHLRRPRLPRRHRRRAGVRAGRHLDLPGRRRR